MAKRKVSNLLALAVLSLLTERPMHPYEVLSVMQHRELSTVVKLNQSSLYSIIEALQREGWIVAVGTQREGRYPERTIYATTEAGRAELADWLRTLLRKPITEYTQFAAALAFAGHLSPEEVKALLEEHMSHLREEMDISRGNIERATQLGVDRVFTVEDRYILTLLEARHGFIQQLIHEIDDGTLTMTTQDGRLIWKVLRPDLATMGSEESNDNTSNA